MQKRIIAKPSREIPRAQHRNAALPLAYYFSKAKRDEAISVGLAVTVKVSGLAFCVAVTAA